MPENLFIKSLLENLNLRDYRMKLIKLIEEPLKTWDKSAPDGTMQVKEPSPELLEKIIADCAINGIDTIVVYK